MWVFQKQNHQYGPHLNSFEAIWVLWNGRNISSCSLEHARRSIPLLGKWKRDCQMQRLSTSSALIRLLAEWIVCDEFHFVSCWWNTLHTQMELLPTEKCRYESMLQLVPALAEKFIQLNLLRSKNKNRITLRLFNANTQNLLLRSGSTLIV